MKIVHVLNHAKNCGNGIVNTATDLACLQADLGHEVTVVSSGGEYENLFHLHGVEHITINQSRRLSNLLPLCVRMNSLLKKEKPDIVHCHMMTGVVICKALKGCRNYKLVSTVHNEFQKTAKLMQLADVVIAVSQQVAEAMIARRISKDKIVVILNGTVFGPRDKFNEHTAIAESEALERPSITAIAGLYRRKGIDILLRAFDLVHKEYPAAHLYIAGEGPDRAYFEDMKAKLSSGEHIKFLGFRNAKKILSETDIFVLPSRVESFGLALSEARAAGCAVMGSNAGGIPEVLERGKAGIIYEVEDYRSLARHILALLNDKDLLNAWKEKAKANIAWLTAERMARDTLALYRRILGNDAL